MKRDSDNAITSVMKQSYKQDATKPEGLLRLNEDIWDKAPVNSNFEYFVNSDKTGEISGKDKLSGMDKYHWYLSDKKLKMEELDAIEMPSSDETDKKGWIEGTQFLLSIDELNQTRGFVYGRLEDKAGNVFYMGSDGIVFDKDTPILSAEYKEDDTWTKDTNVKITGNIVDSNAGLKERYVAYEIPGDAVRMLTVGSDGNFTINNLKDGDYDLTISAWDNANNQADPITFHVKKDVQVPRLIVSGNTTGILAKEEIIFNNEIGASGVKKLEMKFNDGQWQEIENKFDQKIYADKNGKYTFRVTNGLDVVSEEASITFTRIDNKEPILKVESYNGEEIIEANGDGEILNNDGISIVLRNMENNKGETTFSYKKEGDADFTILKKSYDSMARMPLIQDEGTHTYTFKVEAGNGLVKQQTVTYKIDKTVPVGVITFEKDTSRSILNTLALGAFYNEDQKVTMTAQDIEKNGFASGISKVEHFVYGGTSAKISAAPRGDEVEAIEYLVKKQGEWTTGETTFIRDDQAYVVYYKVSDKAGNIGYVRSDEVMMDRVAPIIEIDYDRKDQEWDDKVEIPVSIHDTSPGLDKTSYIVKDQDGVTVKENLNANENFTIDGLVDGIYMIEIHAIDKSGNESVEKLDIKQDGGKPTITAVVDASSFDNVSMDIDIDAKYTGPSGLGQIMMSKNGETFTDITSQILDGKYAVNENGDYIFRAYTKAGAYQEAQVHVDQFKALNVTAKVMATTQDGDIYESDTWANQDVHLEFSNTVANLQGLKHYIKDATHSEWTQVSTSNGKIVYDYASAGSYEVSYKVSLADGSKESAPVSFKVNIDKMAPTAKIKISDKEWNSVWSVLTLGAYFNKKEVATITGEDPKPNASEIKSIKYYYDETKNLPDALEGNTDASKIESAVKDNWINGNQVVLSPNASYVVFGKVEDNAGNVTYVSSDGVVFDDINPTIVSDVDEVNWYTDTTKSLNFDVDDNLSSVDKVTYTINDGTNKQPVVSYGKFNISLSELQQGKNKVVLKVSDKSKNTSEVTYAPKVDTVVPTMSLRDTTTTDLALSRLIEVTPTVGASGIAKVEVKTPIGNEWKDITSSYEEGYIADENGIYVFRVTNKAGVSSAITSIEVGNITTERPLIEWDFETSTNTRSGYIEGTWTNKDVSVAFTNRAAGQTIRSYEYNVDDGPWQSVSVNRDHVARFSAVEGKHTYGMKLVNEIGIESESRYTEIRIDTVNPNVSITDDGQVWNNKSAMIQVEASDDLSGLSNHAYSYDGGNTWVDDMNLAQYVNRATNIWVKDEAGNITSNTYQIDNIDTKAPVMTEFKQEDEAEAKTRNVEVALADYKDDYGNEGSGVAKAYVTALYPYENGELMDESKWIELKKEEDGDMYKNVTPINALQKGENPVYLILVDVAGNTNVVEAEITNMLADPKEEPETKPESKVEKKEVVVNHYIDVVKQIDNEELLTKTEISENETKKIEKEIKTTTKEIKKLNQKLSSYASEKEVEEQRKDLVKMIGMIVLILAILGAIAYMYRYHRLKKKAKGGQAYE